MTSRSWAPSAALNRVGTLVGPRLDWASSQFRDGVWSCRTLSKHITEDMACLVNIERTEALLGGGQERAIQELWVTHVLRREGDDFRIVHRHADPLRPTAPLAANDGGGIDP